MGNKINKILCAVFGCKWLFNFTTLPSRAICERCNSKMNFDAKKLTWNKVDSFPSELGTDEEIKKRWHSEIKY